MGTSISWREALGLAPDPHAASEGRWIGSLPAQVDWSRLEDRLVARGWYPKNAISHLRVYGCEGGHEVVIELAGRRVVIRVHTSVADGARADIAEALGRTLAEEALSPASASAA